MVAIFDAFWRKHPALLYGLSALLGCYAALSWNLALLIPLALLFSPLVFQFQQQTGPLLGRLFLGLLCCLSAFLYVSTVCSFPSLPEEGISGMAYININSLTHIKTHIGKQWTYKGTILEFQPETQMNSLSSLKNLPYKLTIPDVPELKRPLADKSYQVHAKLKESSPGTYILTVKKNEPWHPLEGSWGLAEYRYQAKQAVGNYIDRHFKDPRSAAFLTGIATGDFDDRHMAFEFNRFGLQHIMAISGFHFAIIAAILSGILRFLLPRKITSLVLILLLSSYFIFLGCGPSIIRAWAMIVIVLFGFLLDKEGSALNALGAALILAILYDPLMALSIGFQFSFAITAAILLLHSCMDTLIQRIFSKRSLSQMIQMKFSEQHIYFILSLFRQAIALGIAVNLIALPVTLYYFHKFPLMSLAYNLFFPFMVSLSMLLLFIGMFMDLCFIPLSGMVHSVNAGYTQFMLNFTYNLPPSFDFIIRSMDFPIFVLVGCLSLIFFLGIWARHNQEQKITAIKDLTFI